jgi:site-specific recombinase XerC
MVLPVGTKAARDIDRYVRLRAGHPHAAGPWLWLGKKGRLTASSIYQMIKDRGTAAGLPDLHPHQLRHILSALCMCCDSRHRRQADLRPALFDCLFLAAACHGIT